MAVTTGKEFLDLLQKSQLLSAEQLDQVLADAADGDDPKTIARKLVDAGLLTDWQGAQLVAGRSSFFLGNYKLIQLLGRGGMGGVFLGEHVTMHRRVAVKTISRKVGNEPDALERFLTEARAVASLDHPNVVRAYSVDNEGDRYYLVMEFIDGQDLKQIVGAQGPLEPRLAADYIRQAAEGLQHGHQRNMIHCDVKPSNLLVNREGVVKIVDMGLSLLQDPERKDAREQGDDRVVGTIDYLAPEQALGGTDFDHRVDIYSLGCTLYFLLTGRPPFPEGAAYERLLCHLSAEPEGIGSFRSDVPEELIGVCKKMMAKEPAERYATAGDVAEALGKIRFPLRVAKPAVRLLRAKRLDDDTLPVAQLDGDPAMTEDSAAKGRLDFLRAPLDLLKMALDFLGTPRRKIIAGVVAGVVAVLLLLAALIPLMLGPAKATRGTPAGRNEWLRGSGNDVHGASGRSSGVTPPAATDQTSAEKPRKRPADRGRGRKESARQDAAGAPKKAAVAPVAAVPDPAIVPAPAPAAVPAAPVPEPPRPADQPGVAARVQEEGAEIAAKQPPAPPRVSEGLIARYLFQQDAADSQGKHRSAFRGGAHLVKDAQRGNVVELSGKNDYVELGKSLDLTGEGYSLALWFRTTSEELQTLLAGTKDNSHGILLELKGRTIRYVHRFPFGDSRNEGSLVAPHACDDDRWHHLVAVKNAAATCLYLDGTEVATTPNATRFDAPVHVVLGRLSAADGERYFRGRMSEVLIYNRALGAGEAAALSRPDAKPFGALAETGLVELLNKPPASPTVQPLGKLSLPQDAKVSLELLGGRGATGGSRYLEMNYDADKSYWGIFLASESRTAGEASDSVPIARIALEQQTLVFQWAKDVLPDRANYLFNCGLKISVDGEQRFLPLGPPQEVKPVPLNLDVGVGRVAMPDDRLPEGDGLRLQLVGLEGGFPPPVFEPGDTLSPGGAVDVRFLEGDLPPFWFHVVFEAKGRGAAVEAFANVDYGILGAPPRQFKVKEAETVVGAMVAEEKRLALELEQTKDGNRKKEINGQLQPIRDKIAGFAKLAELYAKVREHRGKLHFRLFRVIDDKHQLTLMQSSTPTEAQPAGPPAAPPAEKP